MGTCKPIRADFHILYKPTACHICDNVPLFKPVMLIASNRNVYCYTSGVIFLPFTVRAKYKHVCSNITLAIGEVACATPNGDSTGSTLNLKPFTFLRGSMGGREQKAKHNNRHARNLEPKYYTRIHVIGKQQIPIDTCIPTTI
jgi:hypothetical protein